MPFVCRAQPAVAKEYQIKAAYLYNFAKFVEWPTNQSPAGPATVDRGLATNTPLVIGVFGQNPFGNELEAIAKDHQINGRDIVIQPVTSVAEARAVQLLFVGGSDDKRIAEVLAGLEHANVLTVGESGKFISAGGMIHFVREGDKVRFEINAAVAEQHGLKISAQLLKLAKPITP